MQIRDVEYVFTDGEDCEVLSTNRGHVSMQILKRFAGERTIRICLDCTGKFAEIEKNCSLEIIHYSRTNANSKQ